MAGSAQQITSEWIEKHMQRMAKFPAFGYGIPAAFAFFAPLGLVVACLIALWTLQP